MFVLVEVAPLQIKCYYAGKTFVTFTSTEIFEAEDNLVS